MLAPQRHGAGNTRGNSGYMNVVEPSISKSEIRRNIFSDAVKMSGTVNSFKSAYLFFLT